MVKRDSLIRTLVSIMVRDKVYGGFEYERYANLIKSVRQNGKGDVLFKIWIMSSSSWDVCLE